MSARNGLRALIRAPTVKNEEPGWRPVTLSLESPWGWPQPDETIARKLSAVDACIEILSNSMAKLPAYVMDSKTRERVDHPILELLNVRPNEAMTPSIRRKVLEGSRLEGGNGYDWIVRDPVSLRPAELIPVPWQLVTPWRDLNGKVWYTVTNPVSGEPMVLPNEDICHYKGATRDGLVGISVLKRASQVIASASAAQSYEKSYYERGGQPLGVLSTATDLSGYVLDSKKQVVKDADGTPLTKKEKLRREWEKVHAGPSNSHRIAVLDYGLSYTPIAGSNRDAQFVESKEVSVRDIARFFGVPLYKLQEGKQSYESNEQNAIEYVVSTLHPNVAQYEEEETWKILSPGDRRRSLEIRINLMAELRGDMRSRGDWYRIMRECSVFSPNDIRALEDLPDVEGGDDRYASLNYIPLAVWRKLSEQRNQGGNSNAGKS